MITIRLSGWPAFKERLAKYASLQRQHRNSHVFRGLGSSNYDLKPTLDRGRVWLNDDERLSTISALHDEFKEEAIRLQTPSNVPDGDALEFLARHYGLPSPLLDWSKSPYVAAYFAFRGGLLRQSDEVAIWDLNIASLPDSFPLEDVVVDSELVRFNPRAKQQRGVFVRVSSIAVSFEEQAGDALRKFVLPGIDAKLVLAELDEMMINSTNLNYDLAGAAETARLRIERLQTEDKI